MAVALGADEAVDRPPIADDEAVHRRQPFGGLRASDIVDHRPGGGWKTHDYVSRLWAHAETLRAFALEEQLHQSVRCGTEYGAA